MALTWDAVQTTAKSKGWLVFAMDQGQDATNDPGPWGEASADGYCMGLACHWMGLCYRGTEFDYDKGTQTFEAVIWQATLAQNLDPATAADWRDWWRPPLQYYGMTLSKGLHATRRHKPTARFVRSIIGQAYGCYAIYMKGPDGAHAIAARHGRDGRFHLFDGNEGHFAVKGYDAFRDFLDWYFDKTGYEDDYTEVCGVSGVKPPIGAGDPKGT